jgi:hypothetical protein
MRLLFCTLALAALSISACSQNNPVANGPSNDVTKPQNTTAQAGEQSSSETVEVTKVSATAPAEEEWGTIKGRIVVKGEVAPAPKIDIKADADFCGVPDPLHDQSIVVGDDGGLKNAFLFLYMSSRDPQKPKIHPSYEASAKDKVEIDNTKCLFEPRVAFARPTQVIEGKNSDPKGHNVQNNSRVNAFNSIIPPKSSVDFELNAAERLPTKLTCNIHPWMVGYLLVRDEPYVAISAEDGSFEIKNMPEGDWQFQFWHESIGYMADLQSDGKPVMDGRPATVTISVKNGEVVDLGELTIDGAALKR